MTNGNDRFGVRVPAAGSVACVLPPTRADLPNTDVIKIFRTAVQASWIDTPDLTNANTAQIRWNLS